MKKRIESLLKRIVFRGADVALSKLGPRRNPAQMINLKHSEAFRGSASVSFLATGKDNVVLTSLPIHQVPADVLAEASSLEEQVLLALSISEGLGFHYFDGSTPLKSISSLLTMEVPEEFKRTFMNEPLVVGKTLVLSKADLSDWFSKQWSWRRALTSLPGEEGG